jgi:predicted amidohydrolase
MKIALVQLDIEWESKKINCERAEEFIKKASHERCDIVAFPEMF